MRYGANPPLTYADLLTRIHRLRPSRKDTNFRDELDFCCNEISNPMHSPYERHILLNDLSTVLNIGDALTLSLYNETMVESALNRS